jgi:protein-S-isoprenylcysteine O-methyltransferase Ste14
MSLFLRHMLWTTLCPGVVTVVIPVFILSAESPGDAPGYMRWIGMLLILCGAWILISCIYMFGKFGKGTLSPFDPARHLVIKGLYRYVRNPMYVGVMIVLVGEALWSCSLMMVFYALIVFVAFNLFIIFYEEPYLRREFGDQYDRYKANVGRWIPGRPLQDV